MSMFRNYDYWYNFKKNFYGKYITSIPKGMCFLLPNLSRSQARPSFRLTKDAEDASRKEVRRSHLKRVPIERRKQRGHWSADPYNLRAQPIRAKDLERLWAPAAKKVPNVECSLLMAKLGCGSELLESMTDDMCDRVARRNYELEIIASQVCRPSYRLSMFKHPLFNLEIAFSYKRYSRRLAAIPHRKSSRRPTHQQRRGQSRFRSPKCPKYRKLRLPRRCLTEWPSERCPSPTIFYSTAHTCNDCVCNHSAVIVSAILH